MMCLNETNAIDTVGEKNGPFGDCSSTSMCSNNAIKILVYCMQTMTGREVTYLV